jgi:hypothetical protein
MLTTVLALLLFTSSLSCWTRVGSQPASHPSYSLDLALSVFHMFGNLKIKLRGQRFTSADTVNSEAQKWLWERDFYFLGLEGPSVRCDS